ncbi:hypothetical protein Tco_1276392 [Tanacetum coccineum]
MHRRTFRLRCETEIDDNTNPRIISIFGTNEAQYWFQLAESICQAAAQPVLYDADTLLHPTHHPVSIWDSEEVLVHQVVSMKKMNEKPGHVRPANSFYDKLNALKFVPHRNVSREQALLLPANDVLVPLKIERDSLKRRYDGSVKGGILTHVLRYTGKALVTSTAENTSWKAKYVRVTKSTVNRVIVMRGESVFQTVVAVILWNAEERDVVPPGYSYNRVMPGLRTAPNSEVDFPYCTWIPTTVLATTPTSDPPVIHDDTSLILAETPTILPITSTIPPTAPTTHYTSPFIYTDFSDDDTPDTPPSPTHEIPPVEVAPLLVGFYLHHLVFVIDELPLFHPDNLFPTVDHHFTSDDSSRDSPSDSSLETLSDSSLVALSDSSPSHSSSDHSSSALPSGMRSSHQLCLSVPSIPHSSAAITERPSHSSSIGLSHKRSRSPTTYVPVSSLIHRALSCVRNDQLPPRKWIKSFDSVTNLEAEIDEGIAYADALRAGGIDGRVVVETVAREEVETSARGMVMVSDDRVTHPVMSDDIPKPAQEEGAIEVTYKTLGDLVLGLVQNSTYLGLRKKYRLNLKNDMPPSDKTMPNIRSGATMIREAVNELIARRVAEVLEARDAARNLEPLAEGGDEQGDENGDDYEGGNGGGNGNGNENGGVNGNRNGGGNGNGNSYGNGNGNEGRNGYENHNMNFRGFIPVARECTYQDFLKCQPLNFNGTEGVVGLTRWFEKMEMVFHISNCPQKNQVKYATYTLLNNALTWWNSHKRTIRIDAAYAMIWT